MKLLAKSILVIMVMITTFSCEKDNTHDSFFCKVSNPAQKLPWLKTMIESWDSTMYPYLYVQRGNYRGQTLFIVGNCCPFCDSYFPVYNCAGDEMDDVNIQDITDLKVIWTPDNSQCVFAN